MKDFPPIFKYGRKIKKVTLVVNLFFKDQINFPFVRVLTHMVSCHHKEALNYKFKHKRADKSLSDADRVDQWVTATEYQINQIAITTNCGVATNKRPQ